MIPPRTAGRPALEPTGVAEVRRSTSGRGLVDVMVVIGVVAAALSLTTLLVTRVIPAANMIGFVAIAYLLFLALYAMVVLSREHDGGAVADRLASVAMHSLAVLALLALLFVVGFTFWRGREALPHLNFFTQDMRLAGSLDPLTVGGILHAMVGTLLETTIALLFTVPLGLACAVYLNEARGVLPRFVRTVVEAMTALPSIVVGLFVFASFILTFGLTRSGLAAGLAIFVMILPIVIRAADVVLRLVPGSLREASFAMGATKWRTAWHVVLPTVRSGLTTAVLLGTARGVGEVSPVLITAGVASAVNVDPLTGPMMSLPLVTYLFSQYSEPAMIARAFGAAVVLLALVLVLFALARVFGGAQRAGAGYVR
ncbi:MAG TPA: phosphate ABC transporter permease PstA [Pseudonocardiaceae bacterium]|nr:phosphate ABC transporter permease PstA [Pseudonocardiaceae bacterium]